MHSLGCLFAKRNFVGGSGGLADPPDPPGFVGHAFVGVGIVMLWESDCCGVVGNPLIENSN